MKTLGTYFESIYHVPASEWINTRILIKPSFFEENDITVPIHLQMDNIFGFCPKEFQHPNVIVFIGNEEHIVGQPITRISLLKPYTYNIWQSNMDRMCSKLELTESDVSNINKLMQASATIIQDPIIDVDKYNLTVYQYILFIYNTGVINLTPSRFTRSNNYKDEEYILGITSETIESVLDKYDFLRSPSKTKPISMDYPMPDYSKLTRVRVEEIDD